MQVPTKYAQNALDSDSMASMSNSGQNRRKDWRIDPRLYLDCMKTNLPGQASVDQDGQQMEVVELYNTSDLYICIYLYTWGTCWVPNLREIARVGVGWPIYNTV